MRAQLARFLSAPELMCLVLCGYFPEWRIKGLQWVSKRWHSSFQLDRRHLWSRWMRPWLARLLSPWKMIGPVRRTLWKDRLIHICLGISKCPYFCQFPVLYSPTESDPVGLCPPLLYGSVFCKKKRLFPSNLRSHWSHFVIHGTSWHKVTSVSQQKMTLFFWSRSSSSFVALNTVSYTHLTLPTKLEV